ncbi:MULTISPECIES: hypothetical protein [Stenotrophomonas maltophilia group]|uniref:hypothetical protein n=1 Tax=Stenotrophomonas maltophilia group TaxID=995085 RepID=UPI0013DCCD15|nr:hypothetical protein [Stenotrophomonas maltophilia]
MKKTVQQPAPESIGQTPDAHSENSDVLEPADTRYDWLREEWRQSNHADQYRLEMVDRALYAASGLQRILIREQRGRALQAAAPDQLSHDLLDEPEAESMCDAVALLLHLAIDTLEPLRSEARR